MHSPGGAADCSNQAGEPTPIRFPERAKRVTISSISWCLGMSLSLTEPTRQGGTMSNNSKLLAVLTLSLAMSSGVLAQETLQIGAPQPMTGPDAPFGDKFKKAYSMAVEEINAAGGVNGKKIEVGLEG